MGKDDIGFNAAEYVNESGSQPHETTLAEEGFLLSLGHSTLYSALQGPVSGVAQLVDKSTDFAAKQIDHYAFGDSKRLHGTSILPHVQFIPAQEETRFGSPDWHGQQIGNALGMVAWVLAANKTAGFAKAKMFRGAAPLAAEAQGSKWAANTLSEVAKSAIGGAFYGGVLTPVDAKQENFWKTRLDNSLTSGLTFATLTASTLSIRKLGDATATKMATWENASQSGELRWLQRAAARAGRELPATLKNRAVAAVLAGVPAGFISAESGSVLAGKGAASTDDILKSIEGFSMVGAVTGIGSEMFAKRGTGKALENSALVNEDGELSHGRNFDVYVGGMDASMAMKVEDIAKHVRTGVIADMGSGSGTLEQHLSALNPHSKIIGVDASHELLRRSREQSYPNNNVTFQEGDIINMHFPDGSVSTVIYSSVLHEVYSYKGYDRNKVREALANTHRALEPQGRLIIRDGVAPPDSTVWMLCDAETCERFYRFAKDFKGKAAEPGIKFEEREVDGKKYFVLGMHEANEFLSKKDYLANWKIEVNEEFGVFTEPQWKQELAKLGYTNISTRSYMNPWILENRYQNHVSLFADGGAQPGEPVAFPDTTIVIVAEKPKSMWPTRHDVLNSFKAWAPPHVVLDGDDKDTNAKQKHTAFRLTDSPIKR